jgi:hypothetical protein
MSLQRQAVVGLADLVSDQVGAKAFQLADIYLNGDHT